MAPDSFPAGMRVLAVDDDRVSLMILERQLQCCNYNVTTAMDVETAMAMLRERKNGDQFDLVISDVVMPDVDGFKFLELIGLEMDLPVIMLSANNETETMMKGIMHGACDYLVKPVRLEQLRGIWTHVMKSNKTEQKLQHGDEDKCEKDGANHTRKYSKKNKKDVSGVDADMENKSTQKRQRIQWSAPLHQKFVEAFNLIGMDRAVPKKILELMNVEGLSRENVASHLQKYRLYLRKLNDGSLKHPNPFDDETEARRSAGTPTNNMTVQECSKHHPELGRYGPSSSFIGSPSSSNLFARMNSPFAVGTHTMLPTESVQLMSSQRNLGIPQQGMEPVGHRVNLPKVAVPGLSFGMSYAPVPSGGPSRASQCFPSGPSGSSSANISNGVVLNTSKPFSLGISGSSSTNISNGSPPLASSMHFPSSRPYSSYASILRGKILGASRGIPFEDIADDEILAPSGPVPLQSTEFVSQPPVQIQSSSPGVLNQAAREAYQFPGPSNSSNSWKAAVPSRFSYLGHDVGTSNGPSQGNIIRTNQLSRLAASSGQIPTFRNVYQSQITGIIGKTTPMVGFADQVAPFSFGSNTHHTVTPTGDSDLVSPSTTRPTLPNLQVGNSAMPNQMLNVGGANDNLPEGVTINQQAVGAQVNNSNELLMGTNEAQNGASGDLEDLLADWVHDGSFINNDNAFINENWDFSP
ncbi:hypothetical protein U9M48_026981 [Paspalum notatum var. saurae]|uniref:Response regulatory domain-containing protein n=1 Tax=Paspalum notatum var. saurae TaxID=547442 RepID=A0AAQ3WZJ3_PASNO